MKTEADASGSTIHWKYNEALSFPVFIGRTEKRHEEHELNLDFPSINR